MKNIQVKGWIILFVILFSSTSFSVSLSYNYVIAGSPSSGDIPPEGGESEDTGGGSAAGGLYLNYRIPLIFTSGIYAPTLISITALQNTTIIFGYESTLFENNTADIYFGDTLIIDPTKEENIENGSLIQSFAPLQINVYHQFMNNSFDDSFSYSVLVMSMWGRIYQSPFDNMRAKIISGYNLTEISIITPGKATEDHDIPVIGESIDVEVFNDTIIEASGPIGVVFYSLSSIKGSFSYTGIPSYLWGREYFVYPPPSIGSIPLLQGETEIVLTTDNSNENILATTNFAQSHIVNLSNQTSVKLSNNILNVGEYYSVISSSYINISMTLLYNYTYNGTSHLSAVQYIAVEKMRWAELFFSPRDYIKQELKSIVLQDDTSIIPLFIYDGEVVFDLGNFTTKNEGDYFSYYANTSMGIFGDGSFFSFMTTFPPESETWNSSANLLYPLNLFSYFDNTSTSFPSWYRFPNINVKEVLVSPSNPTEFRRLQLDILVQNNGSIPSAPFWVTVFVNDSLKIHRMVDGIDINQTILVIYEEFQGLGIKILNVSIYTDSQNQIFELLEFDNALEFFIQISRNWNIIYTSIAIAVLIIGYVSYRLIKRIVKRRKQSKTRFDVILSDIEV